MLQKMALKAPLPALGSLPATATWTTVMPTQRRRYWQSSCLTRGVQPGPACLLSPLHWHGFPCAEGTHICGLLLAACPPSRWNGSACRAPCNAGLLHQRSLAAGLGTAAEKLVGDAYKEARRRDLRTVFNHLRWKQHRSSLRYWRHLLGSWGGRSVADVEGEAVAAFDLPSKARTCPLHPCAAY